MSVNNYIENVTVPNLDNDATAENTDDNDGVQRVTADAPALSEYLSNLNCTACPKNCSLLAPKCSKGLSQAAAAEVDYYEEYGEELEISLN